jgi:hypothetical protein
MHNQVSRRFDVVLAQALAAKHFKKPKRAFFCRSRYFCFNTVQDSVQAVEFCQDMHFAKRDRTAAA